MSSSNTHKTTIKRDLGKIWMQINLKLGADTHKKMIGQEGLKGRIGQDETTKVMGVGIAG